MKDLKMIIGNWKNTPTRTHCYYSNKFCQHQDTNALTSNIMAVMWCSSDSCGTETLQLDGTQNIATWMQASRLWILSSLLIPSTQFAQDVHNCRLCYIRQQPPFYTPFYEAWHTWRCKSSVVHHKMCTTGQELVTAHVKLRTNAIIIRFGFGNERINDVKKRSHSGEANTQGKNHLFSYNQDIWCCKECFPS